MLNKLFKKNRPDGQIDDIDATAETDNAVGKTATRVFKKIVIFVGIGLLCALGFAAVTFMGPSYHSNARRLSAMPNQFSNLLPTNSQKAGSGNAWLSGQPSPTVSSPVLPAMPASVKTAPPAIPVPQKQKAAVDSSSSVKQQDKETEQRDVFKEFYLKRTPDKKSGRGSKSEKKITEMELSKMMNPNTPMQLPPVQALTLARPGKEVRLYGVTCMGNNCVAITNEGMLNEGDKIDDETINKISGNSITTNKRNLEVR